MRVGGWLTYVLCVREVVYVDWAASFSYRSTLLACAICRRSGGGYKSDEFIGEYREAEFLL